MELYLTIKQYYQGILQSGWIIDELFFSNYLKHVHNDNKRGGENDILVAFNVLLVI